MASRGSCNCSEQLKSSGHPAYAQALSGRGANAEPLKNRGAIEP